MARLIPDSMIAIKERVIDYLRQLDIVQDSQATSIQSAQTAANTAQVSANTAQTVANTAQVSANTAQTAANTAQTSANTANTNAANAATTAGTALSTAQNATGRLAGDQDYFEGTGTFTGTPSDLLISSITPVKSVGINYNAGYFTFAYPGKYFVHITQVGDCVNNRTDWYQEVKISIKEVISNVNVALTFKSIPPSGTWNMENSGCNIIDVVAGAQWKVRINMVANGTTSNGIFRIKVKKVI